jgi:hypothetical protein
MDNYHQVRHAAQIADNHSADLELKRLAQAVIALSRLCEQAQHTANEALALSQNTGKRISA